MFPFCPDPIRVPMVTGFCSPPDFTCSGPVSSLPTNPSIQTTRAELLCPRLLLTDFIWPATASDQKDCLSWQTVSLSSEMLEFFI